MNKNTLDNEASMITELLSSKVFSQVFRNREAEVSIEFTDGTKLFIDKKTQV